MDFMVQNDKHSQQVRNAAGQIIWHALSNGQIEHCSEYAVQIYQNLKQDEVGKVEGLRNVTAQPPPPKTTFLLHFPATF